MAYSVAKIGRTFFRYVAAELFLGLLMIGPLLGLGIIGLVLYFLDISTAAITDIFLFKVILGTFTSALPVAIGSRFALLPTRAIFHSLKDSFRDSVAEDGKIALSAFGYQMAIALVLILILVPLALFNEDLANKENVLFPVILFIADAWLSMLWALLYLRQRKEKSELGGDASISRLPQPAF